MTEQPFLKTWSPTRFWRFVSASGRFRAKRRRFAACGSIKIRLIETISFDCLSMCRIFRTPAYFFEEFKELLKERFKQIDIWLTTYPLEVL